MKNLDYICLINAHPLSAGAYSAFKFVEALSHSNHHIRCVFFQHDGVLTANRFGDPAQEELPIYRYWQSFAQSASIDLHCCIAAAYRRGITKETLAPGFILSGLGQFYAALHDANLDNHRLIQFHD